MFIKRLADHWSWGLVSSATVLFIFFDGMVAHDLLNDLPVGTTIRESAVNADPFMLFFSFVASMITSRTGPSGRRAWGAGGTG